MTPFFHALSFIEPTLTEVILPDGSTVDSNESGLLCLSVYCQEHKKRYVLPLLDTLHVRGLRLNLRWVTAFNACGHAVLFDYNTVQISICSTTGGFLDLTLTHLYLRHTGIEYPDNGIQHGYANVVSVVRTPGDLYTDAHVSNLAARPRCPRGPPLG
jgi:hypothetical protein